MTSRTHEDDEYNSIYEDDTLPFRDMSSSSDAFSARESSSMMSTTHEDDPFPKVSAQLRGHKYEVIDVTFIPGTHLLVTCSEDKSIRVWDLDIGKQVGKLLLSRDVAVQKVAASPDGHWIVSGGGKGSILVWEVATMKKVRVLFRGHENYVWSVVFAPDSKTFASTSKDKTICVWKRETGSRKVVGPVLRVKTYDEAKSASYSPDGSRLAAGTDRHIIVWNAVTGQELLKVEQRAYKVTFTPDGLRIVSGNVEEIQILDATTGDIIKKFDAHIKHYICSLAIAPNGTKIATVSSDKTMRVFDLTTFEPIGEPLEHPDVVWAVAFSEDSQLIATACHDKLVRTWTVLQKESQQETISDLPSPDDELPPRFFDDVHTNYPPRRSNHIPYGAPQHSAPQSLIIVLVNRLLFRRESQQAHSSAGHPNKIVQFLEQHLAFRRSIPSRGRPPVVDVAAGRGKERVIVISVPHYKKVHDSRRPPREEPVARDTAQSDTTSVISYADSLPNVHWFMAFLCYLSCWSDGRLRVPPRWDLEPVQSSHQNNDGGAGTHG